MVIRPARSEDLPVLGEMFQNSLAEEDSDFAFPSYPLPPEPELMQRIMAAWALSPTTCFTVAIIDEEIQGYILASSDSRAVGDPRKFVTVHSMYVRPESRRQIRVAKYLVKTLQTWVESNTEADFVEVTTRPTKRQVGRWIRKGYRPYLVKLWKPIKEA